jgi:hypothetical protein
MLGTNSCSRMKLNNRLMHSKLDSGDNLFTFKNLVTKGQAEDIINNQTSPIKVLKGKFLWTTEIILSNEAIIRMLLAAFSDVIDIENTSKITINLEENQLEVHSK